MEVTSSYIDDIYLNEEIVSAEKVKAKLESFGLTCKDPERLKHRAKVMSVTLYVVSEELQFQNSLLK